MSKLLSGALFFVLNYTLFLCCMEQQIIELYNEITIPNNVTAIGFSKNLPLIVYASRGAHDFNTTVAVSDTNENHECGSIHVDGSVDFLCFNEPTWHVGMLTDNGVVLINWEHEKTVTIKNRKDSFYSALNFNKNHCYAGTSVGQLFKLEQDETEELICSMSHGDYGRGYVNKHPKILSIAFNEQRNEIALAGTDVIGDGDYDVFDNDGKHLYCSDGTSDSITWSCFDQSGLLYAVAAGKLVVVDNMKDAGAPVDPDMHSKSFEYDSEVTQLCFDGTNKCLFVGLENGEVYLSKLKNASTLGHPEKKPSKLLLQWDHPIKALSFNKDLNMLGVATLYKAALYRYYAKQ